MKALVARLVLACSILAICANIAGVAAANIDNPKLDHAEIDVSQPVQGLGGLLSIATDVQVNGTC